VQIDRTKFLSGVQTQRKNVEMAIITAFWTTLQNQHCVHADARKAQLLTMASPREVCGMRWEDIDLGLALWTVHGKGQSIHLSKPMIEMLTKVQHLSGVSPYVFFDELTGGPLPSEFLCFGARDIREAFDGWALANEAGAILDAWAANLMGAANV
jgi:integrase